MGVMVVSSVQVHSPSPSPLLCAYIRGPSSGTSAHSQTQILLFRRPLSSLSVLLLFDIPNASFARTGAHSQTQVLLFRGRLSSLCVAAFWHSQRKLCAHAAFAGASTVDG
jgi:hypothetical protein